jgi:hypothetical protein
VAGDKLELLAENDSDYLVGWRHGFSSLGATAPQVRRWRV